MTNQLVDNVKLGISKEKYTKEEFRAGITDFEEKLKKVPGALVGHEMDESMCPLKHTFVDGAYVREIFMPKGIILTSKIHKITHPYFIMKGEVSVATEDGIKKIKAPYNGITLAGTKRLLYIHEDCIWITVHSNPTNTQDLEKIEEEIISPTFKELDKYLEGKDENIKISLEPSEKNT